MRLIIFPNYCLFLMEASFELDVSPEQLTVFLKSLSVIQPALSLGGVESLICSPVTTSHRNLSSEQLHSLRIQDNLLRAFCWD